MLTSLSESVAIVIGNYPTARQAGILPEERGSHVRRDAARVKKQEAQMIIATMRVSNEPIAGFPFSRNVREPHPKNEMIFCITSAMAASPEEG